MHYTTVWEQVERKGYTHLPEGRRKQVLSDEDCGAYIRRALNTGFQFRDLINR